MANIIKFRRKTYSSYKELSRDYPGVPYEVLVYRIRSGWPLVEALLTPYKMFEKNEMREKKEKQKKNEKTTFSFRGKEYHSYKALSRDYPEVPYHLILKRIHSGCPLEEVVLPPQSKILLTYRGKEYTSYKDLARDYPEVPYHLILERIKSGCSLDEAVFPKHNKKSARVVTYQGDDYSSIASLARHLGLGEVDLRNCYKRCRDVDTAVKKCFRRVEKRKRLEEKNK